MVSYYQNLGQYQDISAVFSSPTLNEILTHSISDLLAIFGHGIRMLQSGTSSKLNVPIDPSLKDLFPL
jgi:hypothetical protein